MLSAGGSIHGDVRDRYGAPVAGALVLAVSTERPHSTGVESSNTIES